MPDTKIRLYSVVYTERGNYLHAVIIGKEDSLQTSINFWTEVLDETLARGFKKVLVEEDFENVLSPLEMYGLVKHFGALNYSSLQIAFFDNQPKHKLENDFAERAAHNLGLNVRVCDSLADAESLLSSTPD